MDCHSWIPGRGLDKKNKKKKLPFKIINSAGINVIIYPDGGCHPATAEEVLMWRILQGEAV